MDDSIFTLLASSITGISTFFIGRNRAKKELENMSLSNMEKSIEIYNTIIEDLKSQIEELLSKVDILEIKIEELKVENHELKKMLKEHDINATKARRSADTKTKK